MEESSNLKTVPDGELLRRLSDLVSRSRRLDADVVAHIAEVDARRLYAREATPSMFAYCVEVLRLGESEAYLRIAAARASRKYPLLLEMLRDGRLLLTAVARLASHLTADNCDQVLKRAANRSKREIEELVAELDPKPDARSVIRSCPCRAPGQPQVRAAIRGLARRAGLWESEDGAVSEEAVCGEPCLGADDQVRRNHRRRRGPCVSASSREGGSGRPGPGGADAA